MGDKYGFDLSGAILGTRVTVKEGRKEIVFYGYMVSDIW